MKKWLCIVVVAGAMSAVHAKERVSFNFEIRPILSDKCFFCHGPDGKKIEGKLQLHSFEKATSDRDGEGAAIVPGSLKKSLLWGRITTTDEDDVMPPVKRHMTITPKERALIKQWIEEGAEYQKLWSLESLPSKVAVPAKQSDLEVNEVDRFIQVRLKKMGLAPSKEADRELLLRRVTLTLTGLIPTPEEVRAFQADQSESAYETVVDRLLASPHSAERLAVEWMDVARYADSYGYQVDRPRQVWPWRDWVLEAFKSNLPFDQFITQQLAGDLMPDATDQTRLATTFNRLHGQKVEGGTILEEFRTEYVADRAQTAATAFLGLTMECCRCHDHKYDPVTMKDYYRTFAFFNNIDESGVYSYFSPAIPSPSMPVLKDDERKEQAKKQVAVDEAYAALLGVLKSEKDAFKSWQKNWDGAASVTGKVLSLNFDAEKGGQFVSAGNPEIKIRRPRRGTSVVDDGWTGSKAIRFDGDTEMSLDKRGPFERHHPLSLSVAVKAAESFERAVILHRSMAWSDAASRGYELLIHEGKLDFALVHFTPGNEIRVRTLKPIPVNTWARLTVTYDGSATAKGMRVFVDGARVETEVVSDYLTKEIFYTGRKKPNVTLAARMRDNGFKNSTIDEVSIFDRRLTALEVREHHAAGAKVNGRKEAYEYYLGTQSEPWAGALKTLADARKAYNEYMNKRFHIMVMRDMDPPRRTFVLKRGLYSDPDPEQEVEPGPPASIFPWTKKYERNRFGFAQWLTHPEHPLTARVTVNRYWQLVFGEGLVSTPNDFGYQGALPTHPELLSYLSRSFVDSGWDLKGLLKQMVMSHTFRQSSKATAVLREKDSANQWLARGPSYPMTAEMLRDGVLRAGGRLSAHVGGRSAGLMSDRRSLYVSWKRSDPAPEMLMFGTPRRAVCSVKRERTSTPLQPLVLLNSPFYVKSAKAIAERVLRMTADTDDVRLNELFLLLTGRTVSDDERDVLKGLLADERQYFSDEQKARDGLLRFGGNPPGGIDHKELAAWTVLASGVINLDSFYTVR